jgi:hypothetical protein
MATKLIEAISRILTDCPYVIYLRDLMTKTRLELENGYFLDLYYNETCSKYSYTLIRQNKRIVGWDNAPHHPDLTNFPHHFHAENRTVQPSTFIGDPKLDIVEVIKTINDILSR